MCFVGVLYFTALTVVVLFIVILFLCFFFFSLQAMFPLWENKGWTCCSLLGHQLSMMVKVIPSPDWFVGVDSLNLCEGGQWKQEVTLDLQPYDAGTDSGFTFSSPNFPTNPPENITRVSQTIPFLLLGCFSLWPLFSISLSFWNLGLYPQNSLSIPPVTDTFVIHALPPSLNFHLKSVSRQGGQQ